MNFTDHTVDRIDTYKLFLDINQKLIDRGYRITDGLMDLLNVVYEWIEENTQAIEVKQSVEFYKNDINKDNLINNLKSRAARIIAEELLKKDYFKIDYYENRAEIKFEALICNPLGPKTTIPIYMPIGSFVNEDSIK